MSKLFWEKSTEDSERHLCGLGRRKAQVPISSLWISTIYVMPFIGSLLIRRERSVEYLVLTAKFGSSSSGRASAANIILLSKAKCFRNCMSVMLCYYLWILTLECPFAELVGEIGWHFQVLVPYHSHSVKMTTFLGEIWCIFVCHVEKNIIKTKSHPKWQSCCFLSWNAVASQYNN
jgi:hypothetical protein